MKPLAITLGDPAGIGAEVVLRALQGNVRPVRLFGSKELTDATAMKLFSSLPYVSTTELDASDETIILVDVGPSPADFQVGQGTAATGEVALRSVDAALAAITAGHCSALVTAPLSKEHVARSVSGFTGHTEYLAEKSGLTAYGHDFAMYFDSPRLRVALLSVHVSLREAIELVSADAVLAMTALVDRELSRLYGKRPRIAVAGLNPHAGEHGMFGGREESIIADGVERALAAGFNVSGPHPADTVFMQASRGMYDVVIATFHDQGLIAVKTLDFEHSVNVTLGLPFLRASVDHGTAFDIAGRGIADFRPMKYAIEWTGEHEERYAR